MALSPTSFAILGLLAVRPLSSYELTKEMRRNLHFFWPRAESGMYKEVKQLAQAGLAKAERTYTGRRPRTTYSITAKGRRELKKWLTEPPRPVALEFEAVLRIFLAAHGTKEALLQALERATADAEEILAVGSGVAQEYAEGRAPFQEQVHVRALIFDFLWSYAQAVSQWAVRARQTVAEWDDMSVAGKEEAATALIAQTVSRQPWDRPGRADGPADIVGPTARERTRPT